MDIWTIYIIYLCLLDTIPNVPFQHDGLPLCLPTSRTQRTQIMMDSSTCTVTLMSHSQVLSITRAKKHQGLIYKWQIVLCHKRQHSRTVESYDVTLQRTFQRWCRASLHTTEATFKICCIMWAKLQISCAIVRTLVRGSKFPVLSSSHHLQVKQSSVTQGPSSKEELQMLGFQRKSTLRCERDCTKEGRRELRGSEGSTNIIHHVHCIHQGPSYFARQTKCTGV